jgi:amino acid transporter/nucleotide-binding universal stress UspA family protein
MDSITLHRPRNVDWKRAAALIYGDLGTSKAYVIGLAFLAAGYASIPIILAVCGLTALVCWNYVIVCKHFPEGGGVYSAARTQSRLLAVTGALLLVADLTVTSAMSAWTAMSYFGVPQAYVGWSAIGLILLFGAMNAFGPKHSGTLAVTLAFPMVVVVGAIILLSIPHLSLANLKPPSAGFSKTWVSFVGVILALSGVETIANLTGVLKLDPGSTVDKPKVVREAAKSILPVGVEVVLGTALLGWAMLSLPGAPDIPKDRCQDMLRYLAEEYGHLAFGVHFSQIFGIVVGMVVGLLLLGAVNTSVVALIGLIYIMARDGEMPKFFTKLNHHGVPYWPMVVATVLPMVVVFFSNGMQSLANLYAIGVVGAITVNLGSCSFNKKLDMALWERVVMAATFVVLSAVEVTIAKTKPDALFFAICILGSGLALRAYAQKRAGLQTLTVTKEIAAAVSAEAFTDIKINLDQNTTILVAARGVTPVLRFAMEEAKLRQAMLYVLYVRELAVALPAPIELAETSKWQNYPQAAQIMYGMLELGRQNQVTVVPLYTLSDDPAATILDLSATLGVDMLILGAAHRHTLASILKGNVVSEVARNLPDSIQLVIHG